MKSDLFKIIRAAGYVVLIVVWFFLMLAVSGCAGEEPEVIFSDEEGEVLDLSNATDASGDVSSEEDNERILEREKVVVFVCGAVKRPGVYELFKDERVSDAILLAGGFSHDAAEDYLNLAKSLTDGEKIYIPTLEELSETGIQSMDSAGSEPSERDSSSLVNINTATKEELMTLPGVGESKADKIIAYRENYGGFASCEDIMQVSGIKEGMYNKICDKICAK